MPTASKHVEFAVTCPHCYAESVLVPRKVKLGKIEKGLGGYVHHLTMSFLCPKCGVLFINEGTKWVRDASEVAPRPKIEIPSPLPAKTNSVTTP